MPAVTSELLTLLALDVTRTLGDNYRHFVSDAAENVSGLEISDPSQKVVDDVQQRIHDEFIDTVWPGCPKHSNHPLWYDAGSWWCEHDGVRITPLGELRASDSENSFRQTLEELQQRWAAEDDREKISNRVTMRLSELYRRTEEGNRSVFDAALIDWIDSDDPGKRFDACVLIGEFKICAALPAVRQALASWQRALAQHANMAMGGAYGLTRSHALAAVDQMQRLVRTLDADCRH